MWPPPLSETPQEFEVKPRTDGKRIDAFDLGCFHGCASLDGDMYCWGQNDHGHVGDLTRTDRLSPVRVQLPP